LLLATPIKTTRSRSLSVLSTLNSLDSNAII
jgi:hypothetical protein